MQRNKRKQENGKDQRSLQENWRYKGNISYKNGHNKGQTSKDLTEAEILRRGGKNTQKNYTKKGLNDLDYHNSVVTHLEPDILECEVKWALGSIITNKASEGDRISAELFNILKDDAVKVLTYCQQIWKIQQWPQDS